jgi:hypothetical protein
MCKLAGFATETAASFVLRGKPIAKTQASAAKGVRTLTQKVHSFLTEPAATIEEAGTKAEEIANEAAALATGGAEGAGEAAAGAPPEAVEAITKGVADLRKYDSPLQAKLATFAEDSARQARGVDLRRVPHAATLARAKKLPQKQFQDLAKLEPGTVMNSEESVQSALLFKEPLMELTDHAANLVKGDPEAAMAFEASAMRALDPTEGFVATQTEAGRSIEALKISGLQERLRAVHDIFTAFQPEAAASGNWTASRETLAKRILELNQTPEKVERFFSHAENVLQSGHTGRTRLDLYRQGYNAILLLKPATWNKKIFGDASGGFDKTLQYSFAGYLSPDNMGVLKSDGPMMAKAMLAALTHHFVGDFAPMEGAIKTRDVTAALVKMGVNKAAAKSLSGFFDYGGDPERWNVPGRIFETITQRAQQIGLTTGQYMHAQREATRMLESGLIKENQWVDTVVNIMDSHPIEGLMEGINIAGDMTYTNPLGGLGKAVQNTLQFKYGGWLVTPFFHIPANLVNRAFSNIPVVSLFTRNVARGLAGEAGPVERDLQLGRLAIAQMSSQFMWLMAKGGMLTGSGPQNPKERQVWIDAGNRPFSIKLGDSWYPTAWLGPWGIQSSIIADAAYIADYFDQPSLENFAGSMLIASAHAVSHEPYFEAWGRLAAAFQDPEKSGGQQLAQGLERLVETPATVATGGPVIATAARELDPYYKSVDNLTDDIKQNIPILRENVPTRLNPLTGEKEMLPAPWGAGWLRNNNSWWSKAARIGMAEINPAQSVPVSRDPVAQEMQNVGATFPNFKMSRGAKGPVSGAAPEPGQAPPVNLTAAESEQLIGIFANRKFDGEKTTREFLQERMADPAYADMPRVAKQKMFDSILRGNNAAAFRELKAKNPDVAYRYVTSGLKKMLDAAPADQRDQIEKEYLESMNQSLQAQNEALQLESLDRNYEDYNQPPYPVEFDNESEEAQP